MYRVLEVVGEMKMVRPRWLGAWGLASILAIGFLFPHDAGAGVIDYPKRRNFDAYAGLKGVRAETIVRRYAATLVIRCSGRQASGQITGAVDVITTSAHLFFNRETCQPRAMVDACEITAKTASGQRKYKDFEMVDHGYRKFLESKAVCPRDGLAWGDDWAILRLKNAQAVSAIRKEIRPYRLPSAGNVHEDNEKVVAVAGAALDFFDFAADGTKFYPRNVQDCEVRSIIPNSGAASYVETDCDTAELSSGGSLLRSGVKGDTLIGLHMGSFETKEQLTQALLENRTNTRPFKRDEWASLYVSVDGEFLRALQRAIGVPVDEP